MLILMSADLPSPRQEAHVDNSSIFPQEFDREESWVIRKGYNSFGENMATGMKSDLKPGLGSDLGSDID
jgi:hypothetical protein